MRYAFCSSKIGELLFTADEETLTGIYFENSFNKIDLKNSKEDCNYFKDLTAQMDLYFARELKSFNVNLKLEGTPFQKDVWQELQKIPYGTTISYKDLAKRVGREKAIRAVGNANGKNKFPIVIPCHRVISSDKSLGGFSSGLENKKKLLELEGSLATITH